jgi:hypothetical protein
MDWYKDLNVKTLVSLMLCDNTKQDLFNNCMQELDNKMMNETKGLFEGGHT